MRLLPREEKFYRFFDKQVRLIVEATDLLSAGVANRNLGSTSERMKALERDGDAVKHEVVEKLHATFITPLDPEDIHGLASSLDLVLNLLEETSQRLYYYRLDCLPDPAVKIVNLLAVCAKSLESAFGALSENKSPKQWRIEINQAEHQVHVLSWEALGNLYDNESNMSLMLKLRDIYKVLERVADQFEEVADLLEYVTVKNG
jgi:uncharacterized protein